MEVPAIGAARETEVNRHTAERVYTAIRLAMARECEQTAPVDGEAEVDESYFGGHRKGKRGRGAAGKVPVFGILKRKGKVYTRIVEDVSGATLRTIIRTQVVPEAVIYSDSFRSYDGLVLDGFKHYRINHDQVFASGKRTHINGIENFWGYAKTKLRRYYGIDRRHFYLYLKEMEFRFNHRSQDLPSAIEKVLKKHY